MRREGLVGICRIAALLSLVLVGLGNDSAAGATSRDPLGVVIRGVTSAVAADALASKLVPLGFTKRAETPDGRQVFSKAAGISSKLFALSPGSTVNLYVRFVQLAGGVRVLAAGDEAHDLMLLVSSRTSLGSADRDAFQVTLNEVRDSLESHIAEAAGMDGGMDDSVGTASPVDGPGDPVEGVRIVPVARPEALTVGPVVAADGAVWVALQDAPSLLRVDAASMVVTSEIPLASPVDALSESDSVLWLVSSEPPAVARYSMRSNTIEHTFGLPAAAEAVATGFGALWIADREGGLHRLPPDGTSVRSCRIRGRVTGLACCAGAVWAQLPNGLVRVDPERLEPESRIKLGGWPSGFAADSASMWIIVLKSDFFGNPVQYLSRRDGRTGEELFKSKLRSSPRSLFACAGTVWRVDVAPGQSGGFRMTRLHRESHADEGYRDLPVWMLWELDHDGRFVWAGTGMAGALLRFDPAQLMPSGSSPE